MVERGKKLLIVKLGAIGDVLRTTSLLPGLREKYPMAKIDWLTSTAAKEILLNNPLIENLFIWEEKEKLGEYDLVIGLEDDFEVCRFVYKIKTKKILGAYEKDGKQIYTPSAWFDMSLISRFGIDRANELKQLNQKTYQQHISDLLGIKISPYVFNLTPEEIEHGRQVFKKLGLSAEDKVVGVNTGAGKRWPQKSWGAPQAIALIKRLKEELGVASLILGGEEERARNRLISSETGMPDAGSHSLRYFAAIINQCHTVLSSDSLAMHFALALQKKTIVLFGPTSSAEIELYGLGKKIIPLLDCVVCYKKKCAKEPNCMDSISVEEVFDKIIPYFS